MRKNFLMFIALILCFVYIGASADIYDDVKKRVSTETDEEMSEERIRELLNDLPERLVPEETGFVNPLFVSMDFALRRGEITMEQARAICESIEVSTIEETIRFRRKLRRGHADIVLAFDIGRAYVRNSSISRKTDFGILTGNIDSEIIIELDDKSKLSYFYRKDKKGIGYLAYDSSGENSKYYETVDGDPRIYIRIINP